MTQQRPQWRTSSYSGNSGNCVQVTIQTGHAIAVRDSKNPSGPALAFSPQLWQAFVSRTRAALSGNHVADDMRGAFRWNAPRLLVCIPQAAETAL